MTGEFKDYSIENQVRLYTIPRSDHICGLSAPGYLIILPLNCYICLVFHYLVKVPDLVYSKVSPGRKGGLWALGGFSNSELTSVGSVSYSCSYLFFLLTNRPSEAFLI